MAEEKTKFRVPKIPLRLNLTAVLVALSALIVLGELFLGTGGCIEVEPGEVAVLYNNTGVGLFGDRARVLAQGAQTFIPGVQAVEVLDRRPHVFVMSNEELKRTRASGEESNVGKSLTVRANDGSNFFFDRLEIHYQLVPSLANTVLETSGPGDAYQHSILGAHAREILRDEFGRHDFLEIANPTTYSAATTEAKRRLNEILRNYGMEVTQIVTPKPKFEARVEKAIEDRQNAEQEVEVQEEKRRKLELEMGLKIQAIEQEKSAEFQALTANLESRKKEAVNKLISVKREADKYHIDRVGAGTAYRDEKVTRAKANEVAYRKEAQGLVAKITAVGASGPDVLNRVIAERVFPQLKNVSATPLVRPASTVDIRHISAPPEGGQR